LTFRGAIVYTNHVRRGALDEHDRAQALEARREAEDDQPSTARLPVGV
jgi:hypothetical protein